MLALFERLPLPSKRLLVGPSRLRNSAVIHVAEYSAIVSNSPHTISESQENVNMGGLNHQTWKQPPASLRVEWPTKSTFKEGPSLDEQKSRMKETRKKVSDAITASGFIAPRWPEVGQQVQWSSPNASLDDELAKLTSHRDGQSSSVANTIPLRFQSSAADRVTRSSTQSTPHGGDRSTTDQHESPLLQLLGRRQERLQQTENNTPDNTTDWPEPDDTIPGIGFPHSFNADPRIHVVQLPDHMFLRPPPAAPRAMLDRSTRFGRPRRHTEATETSFDSADTRRARGYSSATSDTHHSFEPYPSDCKDECHWIDVCGNSETNIPDKTPETPIWSRTQSSVSTFKADSRHVLDTPRVVRPPPGFEPHKTKSQGTTPQPSSGVLDSAYDLARGSWSESRTWFSEQERLRLNFARLREKAHHLGLDKSPFLPETVGEYAALLAERKAAEAKRIRKKIQQNENAERIPRSEVTMVSHRSQLINANCLFFGEALIDEFVQTSPPPPQQIELFDGKKARDGLSLVLAMETCFNEIPNDTPESERVDWPPDAEFRNWKGSRSRPPPGFSRRRGSSHRGVWPFPRTNAPFRPQDSFPNNDIPYSERRMIFAPRWDWMPKFSKTIPDESHIPAASPLIADISLLLPSDLFL